MTLLQERFEIGGLDRENDLIGRDWPSNFNANKILQNWHLCDSVMSTHLTPYVTRRSRDTSEYLRQPLRLVTIDVSEDKPGTTGQIRKHRIGFSSTQQTKSERVSEFFARRVSQVEIVNEVRFALDEDGVTAWVITEGTQFDFESNKPIYEAALDTMRLQEEPIFDFRVINVNELPEGRKLEDTIPANAVTLRKQLDA